MTTCRFCVQPAARGLNVCLACLPQAIAADQAAKAAQAAAPKPPTVCRFCGAPGAAVCERRSCQERAARFERQLDERVARQSGRSLQDAARDRDAQRDAWSVEQAAVPAWVAQQSVRANIRPDDDEPGDAEPAWQGTEAERLAARDAALRRLGVQP